MTTCPTKSDTLATLLASLTVTYTVRFNHDGTWEILSSGAVKYRGTQKECLNWLDRQPTS